MFSSPRPLRGRTDENDYSPPVDVKDTGRGYELIAELPGVRREDVTIEVEGDRLVLRGEKHLEQRIEGFDYLRVERRSGPFHRVYQLPKDADSSSITATFELGLLKVTIPRKVQVLGRAIPVR
ncbi:MAG: hypothetical protein A2284_17485 [Deltaproteobacteria bacterium RIFOXYA12_FULL_61_11]|nr:MAG: hypothetical protein A2284_17485 [Deltaproteobacteria bacterium RIFOXYA12_FULL_61_11]